MNAKTNSKKMLLKARVERESGIGAVQ